MANPLISQWAFLNLVSTRVGNALSMKKEITEFAVSGKEPRDVGLVCPQRILRMQTYPPELKLHFKKSGPGGRGSEATADFAPLF